MKVYFFVLSLFISTFALAQEDSFYDKSFKINKRVTIGWVSPIEGS